MKKTLALILAIVTLGLLCTTGCVGSGGSGLEMVSSYMEDDSTVVVKFRNETNKTITYVSGKLNLFTGSASSQNAIKSPSFTWSGNCSAGSTFTVTVNVSGAPAGLANAVNRIGHYIFTIE